MSRCASWIRKPRQAGADPSAGSDAGVAQLVELQPSKLDVAGSNPVARSSPRDVVGTRGGRGGSGARRVTLREAERETAPT